jgi:hypothetical protein
MPNGSGTVDNAGTIIGTNATAISVNGAVTVSNTATISGANGIGAVGSVAITNDSTIEATSGNAISGSNGGSVTNAAGDLITGVAGGVIVNGATGTISNLGTIDATASTGIAAQLGAGGVAGVVTNGSLDIISGGKYGVYTPNGSGTVDNAGTIIGGVGLSLAGKGSTIVTSGVISGTGGTAIAFGGGNDRLVIDPGASIGGRIVGAGATDVLELAAGTSGILPTLGTSVASFGTLAVDAGAVWTLGGTFSATLSDAGVVDVAAGATLALGSVTGSGSLVIGQGGTLELMAALAGSATVAFTGADETLLLGASAALAGAISSAVSGDTIALAGQSVTSVQYEAAGNQLVIGGSSKSSTTLSLAGAYAASDFTISNGVVLVGSSAAPSISGILGAVSVPQNGSITPFASLTVSDPNAVQSVTLTITLSDPANGSLSGPAGTYNPTTGQYQISGSPAAVAAAAQALVFTPSAAASADGATTVFSVNVSDGVSIDAANDATEVTVTIPIPGLPDVSSSLSATEQSILQALLANLVPLGTVPNVVTVTGGGASGGALDGVLNTLLVESVGAGSKVALPTGFDAAYLLASGATLQDSNGGALLIDAVAEGTLIGSANDELFGSNSGATLFATTGAETLIGGGRQQRILPWRQHGTGDLPGQRHHHRQQRRRNGQCVRVRTLFRHIGCDDFQRFRHGR